MTSWSAGSRTPLQAGDVVLDLPAVTSMVSTARLVISSLAVSRRELPHDRVDDLKLAVSEACANAIESYRPEVNDPRVAIGWTEDDDGLQVSVTDGGRGYDAGSVVAGGFGVGLIKALVDEVTFTNGSPGTTVRMTVGCPRASAQGY